MIEVFKIVNKIYDYETTKSLLTLADNNTRNYNGFKLSKVHTNTSAYQHFFTNRVVNFWNDLPSHVVKVDTVNAFKNTLDRHYSHIKYLKRVDYEVVKSHKA